MTPFRLISVIAVILIFKSLEMIDAMSMDQIRQAGKMMRNMCQPKTGVSSETLDAASTGQFDPNDKKFKCYTKCIMGMMQSVKGNKYNADVAINLVKKMMPDDTKERSVATIQKCRGEWDGYEDKCDAAYAITECMYNADPEVFFLP